MYVPYLAWQIYENNMIYSMKNDTDHVMNLKGFLVGNGATHWDYDVSPSYPRTLYGFNMIPKYMIDYFETNNCTYFFNDFRNHSGPHGCDAIWDEMNDLASDQWWYDLYKPANTPLAGKPMTAEDRIGYTMVNGKNVTYKRGMTMREYTPWLAKYNPEDPQLDMVTNDVLSDYLNWKDTKNALHIPSYAPTWSACNEDIDYDLFEEASFWIYEVLKDSGIKMIFYSGDADGAVNTYGTKRWIQELGWSVKDTWAPWFGTDGQVGGFHVTYENNFEFATIKGVGHLAPKYAPANMLQFVTNWIHNLPL